MRSIASKFSIQKTQLFEEFPIFFFGRFLKTRNESCSFVNSFSSNFLNDIFLFQLIFNIRHIQIWHQNVVIQSPNLLNLVNHARVGRLVYLSLVKFKGWGRRVVLFRVLLSPGRAHWKRRNLLPFSWVLKLKISSILSSD